jgi:hypothetical protein
MVFPPKIVPEFHDCPQLVGAHSLVDTYGPILLVLGLTLDLDVFFRASEHDLPSGGN